MAGLRSGDRVDVVWSDSLRLNVQGGAVVPADPDEFRHRFTVSVLLGVDNQFSGKMIQEDIGIDDDGGAHPPE